MATSQELIQQLITEASTLTAVFRNYRTALDASVLAATNAITAQLNTSMATIISNYNDSVITLSFYIDAVAGNDLNSGRGPGAPYKTVEKALSQARPNLTLIIYLCRAQTHIVNGSKTVNGNVYFFDYANDASIAADPRAANLYYWGAGWNTTANHGSATLTALSYEDYCKPKAILQFNEGSGIDLSTFNTRFASDAECAAYAATAEWTGRNLNFGLSVGTSTIINKNIYFGHIVVSGPRWDLVKPSYRNILKKTSINIINMVDHASTCRISAYATVFKLNYNSFSTNNTGPGRNEYSFYNALFIMEKNFSRNQDRYIINNGKLLIIDNHTPTFVWSDGVMATDAEKVAACSSSLIFKSGVTITNDLETAENVICSTPMFTAKKFYDGQLAMDSYKYVAPV